MGTIIGFYFGHKPVQELTREINAVSREVEKQKRVKNEGASILEETIERYEKLEKSAELMKKRLNEYIKGG